MWAQRTTHFPLVVVRPHSDAKVRRYLRGISDIHLVPDEYVNILLGVEMEARWRRDDLHRNVVILLIQRLSFFFELVLQLSVRKVGGEAEKAESATHLAQRSDDVGDSDARYTPRRDDDHSEYTVGHLRPVLR